MQMPQTVKHKYIALITVALVVFLIALLIQHERSKPALKIGILHSLTGTMVISEKPLVDALQFAIEEVNAAGGINGQMVEAVVRDCRSDAEYCAKQAEQLITGEKVKALFGCWTSTCRKAVKAVVEKHQNLLFYPVQYEGMEQSPNIIYTGATPNQQIIPGTGWAIKNLGKRIYLLGSDYLFPRMANIIIKDMARVGAGEVVGERYLPLGTNKLDSTVAEIVRQKPDVVLNTLNGGSNFAFFDALGKAGINAKKIPVLSFSLAEAELASMATIKTAGHYAAWNYFQSIPTQHNKDFVTRYRQRFGEQAVFDDPMEASYIGMMLWAQAAREAGSALPQKVLHSIGRQTLLAPEGLVAVDPNTHHLWKTSRIGKIRQDGQFDIVHDAGQAVEPAPFPYYRFKEDWLHMLSRAEGKE